MEDKTPVFNYGSNHPEQISKRLNLDLDYVLENSVAWTLKGYKRAFDEKSRTWNSTSPSTIIKDEDEQIDTYAFYMTNDQLEQMDKFEGVPNFYQREEVELIDKLGNVFSGITYIMNSK